MNMGHITLKLNRTVFEMWLGILIFGLVCELGILGVNSKLNYSICLWVGIITAFIAAYHMWWSIDRCLDYGPEAVKKLNMHFIIRYIFLVVILGIMGVLFGSYVLATFLGIMGMKAAAYMQPFTKKLSIAIYGEEILPPVIDYLYDEEEPADKTNTSAENIE